MPSATATTTLEDALVRLASRLALAKELVDELTWEKAPESDVDQSAECLLESTIDAAIRDIKRLDTLPADVMHTPIRMSKKGGAR